MSRSRRDAPKNDRLAQLKLAREGVSRVKQWKQEEEGEIYDEVSEADYQSIVKGRLQRDDFVVDDGIDGYMDNGMEEWDLPQPEEESDDEPKKKVKQKVVKPPKPIPQPASISAYRPAIPAEKEEDFMANLFSTLDSAPLPAPTTTTTSRKRKQSPVFEEDIDFDVFRSPPAIASSDPPGSSPRFYARDTFSSDDPPFSSPAKRVKLDSGSASPTTTRVEKLDVGDLFDPSFDDDFGVGADYDMLLDNIPPVKQEEKPIIPLPPMKPVAKKEENGVPAWLSVHASLNVNSAPDALGSVSSKGHAAMSTSKVQALEDDGSLRMFWLDYLETDGKVYFIGKVLDKPSGRYVSCCVTVEGIERNVYVLPRERMLDGDYETDVVPSKQDVFEDFDSVRRKAGIKAWGAKWVKRKYAFGEKDVPLGESDWMKVVYGFDENQISSEVSSPNFARVFGTGTSAFELLVLKRKIMGPCWLDIKNPEINNETSISWAKLEVIVKDPKTVNPFSDSDPNSPKDMPPLTFMSLSIRTIVNHQENKREVVCITARTWENMQLDDPTPPEKLPCTVNTFVRSLDAFPKDFEARARANKFSKISPVKGERMLLSSLLVTIQKLDPDVFIGHEFLGVSFEVLLQRMRELKVDNWSRIGRFRRPGLPVVGKQGSSLKFLQGRLLCDLASDSAKSMIESTTWSLTEMCNSLLKCERQDIDPDDTASYFDSNVSSPDRLIHFVQHCEMDAHFQMALASKVQILQLTRQLTNLAGNSWNKTLNGGRAERNEYILLHEFHRLKYICPDKGWGKKPVPKADAEKKKKEGEKKEAAKKQKYKGGLVFEPTKGLFDKFILVMDFNSLYPSIIQEYNIDFTTIDREEGEDDKIPDVPSADQPQGVLPRLIATLVSRRKQVKNLMKEWGVTPAKLIQYDIKQKALKLTANSMYGCLGFENSRFYAKPLAALTTFMGREIITHTRELAESLQLEVVYGDTDSIFINSKATDLASALKVAHEFKKQVNDRYRLLEIDVDSVFQRLLLLQKKKYAAVKVIEGGATTTEIKGLDMKRREYSILSKNVSNFVLGQILSGEATETVVENIHEYLRTIGDSIRDGKISVEEFIIHKRLSKDPEDYPDAKSQPHVQVGLKIKNKGGSAKSGDIIPYVFCEEGTEEKLSQAEKARHPDDVKKFGLKIDFEYYLSHQVLPPIERLCDPIAGTDRTRLAECLGLDPRKFQSTSGGGGGFGGDDRAFIGTLDSQISDTERFKDVIKFGVTCPKCQCSVMITPIGDQDLPVITAAGPGCPTCKVTWKPAVMEVQLELAIRSCISKYYEGNLVCDDPTCGNQTRMMRVYGRKCLKGGCRGNVRYEYSDSDLYTQLLYFASLFDEDKARSSTTSTSKQDAIDGLLHKNQAFLQRMNDIIEKYLDQCGRRYVGLGNLFSFMS